MGGGSNPKAGGWILDFAGDVIISRGCSLKLVSPSMIWQCALGGVGGACGEKNLKNALKVIFRGTILGVFFFIFSRHRGGGGRGGGLTNVKFFFFEGFPYPP